MNEWCETCRGRDYMECKNCGWHVQPARDDELCLTCREKGVAS